VSDGPAHDHQPTGRCLPSCPAFALGVLELLAVQGRHGEMLAACRASDGLEFVVVAPSEPGVVLPPHLAGEELVRLNLVVGRDTPELLLDEWGLRCTLTFSGRRHDCALPWSAVYAGGLRPPARWPPRFGVIPGGKQD
jgi:hypothetical protein